MSADGSLAQAGAAMAAAKSESTTAKPRLMPLGTGSAMEA
jgi:hypothetical protein